LYLFAFMSSKVPGSPTAVRAMGMVHHLSDVFLIVAYVFSSLSWMRMVRKSRKFPKLSQTLKGVRTTVILSVAILVPLGLIGQIAYYYTHLFVGSANMLVFILFMVFIQLALFITIVATTICSSWIIRTIDEGLTVKPSVASSRIRRRSVLMIVTNVVLFLSFSTQTMGRMINLELPGAYLLFLSLEGVFLAAQSLAYFYLIERYWHCNGYLKAWYSPELFGKPVKSSSPSESTFDFDSNERGTSTQEKPEDITEDEHPKEIIFGEDKLHGLGTNADSS